MDGSGSKPRPSGFHLKLRAGSIAFGIVGGLGYLILMQQYGLMTASLGRMLLFMLVGLCIGILLPSLATAIPRRRRSIMHPAPAATPTSGGPPPQGPHGPQPPPGGAH